MNSKTSYVKDERQVKIYVILGVTLNCISFVSLIMIGIYLTTTSYILSILSRWFFLKVHFYIVVILTFLGSFLILLNIFLLLRRRFKLGGIMSFVLGGMITLIYIYYTFFIPLLNWLGFLGYMLGIPLIISGFLSMLTRNYS